MREVIEFYFELPTCGTHFTCVVGQCRIISSISRQFLALYYKLACRSEQLTSTSPITNVYATQYIAISWTTCFLVYANNSGHYLE